MPAFEVLAGLKEPPVDLPPAESEQKDTVQRQYKVLPFRADQTPSGEIILPGVWKRLHDEEIFEMFFHDYPNLTFGQFVQSLSNPTEKCDVVCEVDGDKIVDTAAITILTQIQFNEKVHRALGNFLLFRKYWNHKDSVDVGKEILRHWFEQYELETVVGVTPKLNRAALQFIYKFGFRKVGELPAFASYKGETSDCVVTVLTKTEWAKGLTGK